MTEETTTVERPQAGAEAQSQADTTPTEEAGKEGETISLDEARKLRNENRTLRERAKTAEGKVSTFETEKLTATEKLQNDLKTATETVGKRETALRSVLLQNTVSGLKDGFGLRSVKSIVKLIDTEALGFDVDGLSVNGVEAELKRIKKEDPDLFVSGGTDGGAGGGRRAEPTEDMNALVRNAMLRK